MKQIELSPQISRSKDTFSPLLMGYIAMTLVLLIWSGFALTMRAIHSSPLATADVALIRFAVPFILLLPFLPSRFQQIKNARWSDIMLILLGGLPFFFLAAYGASKVPTAYVGNFLVGTQPFFVPTLLYLVYRQTLTKTQGAALALILIGIMVMTFGNNQTLSNTMKDGLLFLIAASMVWAVYTIGLKRATLDPIAVALILSAISMVITIVMMIFGFVDSHLEQATLQNSFAFILVQGVGVGVLATTGYTYAIRQLGAARAAVMGSLSPVLTALLAFPIFGESLSMPIIVGISLTTIGVLLSTRTKPAAHKENN
ncbi:DMT family transporter [Marinomonas arenicola]|uniref:DMT family transporter n=1 Tax=Marinomonas arenicola TaxID=569601 RepID=A0ABU9G138_9GAMM